MTTSIVKISFTAPVHFGRGRLSDGAMTCSAGTIFSALFVEALRQNTQDALLDAAKSGRLLLSDAFPWIKETHYLPKPYFHVEASDTSGEESSSVMKKAFKRLRYLPTESYPNFFSGQIDAVELADDFSRRIGASALTTKVNLGRKQRDETELYVVGGFRFAQDAGIYFFTEGDYDIIPLLDALQYSGLGGKRSSGYGRFEYSIDGGAWVHREGLVPKGLFVLLSSTVPGRFELTDESLDSASYLLEKISGFVQSENFSPTPVKRRDLFVFAPGSTFRQTFKGTVYDTSLGGSHPVWRYGKAFWIGGRQ